MVKLLSLVFAEYIVGLVGGAMLSPPPSRVETSYSKGDQKAMAKLHASLPVVHKLPPFSMPRRSDARFFSLAKLASKGGYGAAMKPSRDPLTETLTAYEQGRMK